MSFKIVLANRLIKVIGTIVKTLSYPFHFIFKKKRFLIPKYSAPIIKSKTNSLIPKKIWQTNYSNNVSLPMYINYLFNRLLSLDYEYNYVSTEERLEYLKENASKEIFNAYSQLVNGASQADLWRLFVLNHQGGVYMDIDAHLVWSLSGIVKSGDEEVFLLNKEHYTNYFIASKPDNTYLKKAIEIIVENIQQKKIDRGVYDLTGPTVLNLAIGDASVNSRYYRITCIQGSFTNEYFQYIDKPRGKWTHMDKEDLLKKS